MHPYNPYEFFPPDFAALAAKSEKLARLAVRTKGGHNDGDDEGAEVARDEVADEPDTGTYAFIDFRDPESSIALTEAMLEQDFGLHVTLRQDRLCPPIPNRINYIAWLQEIIDETIHIAQQISYVEKDEISNDVDRPSKRVKTQSERVRILDIGTGASCIYPILGCALDDWEFVATDIDSVSIEAARTILDDPRNQGTSQGRFNEGRRLDLHDRIHLSLRKGTDDVLPSELDVISPKLDCISWPQMDGGLLYHAVMCNPPFYRDEQELLDCTEAKVQGPSAVCLGSEGEMICDGGEVAFVIRIIDESVHLKARVLWFTSTLGKFADIFPIVKRLIEVKPESIMVTEFAQGRTKRWAIAWSFLPYRMDVASWHSEMLSLPVLGHYNNTQYFRPVEIKSLHPRSEEDRLVDLVRWLQNFSLTVKNEDEHTLVVFARSKSWSRTARRAKLRGEDSNAASHTSKICILCARLRLDDKSLIPTWLYGHDKVIWESFHSTVLLGWVKHTTDLESAPVL